MAALPASRAENVRGALFMVVAMAAFVINDTLMKSLAGEVPIFQAVFLRGLMATALIAPFAFFSGALRPRALPRRDIGRIALRSAGEIGATICFLIALFAMPIANVTAILLAAPLMLTMVGALFLGEPVGWRRWSAVVAGFLGVLMVVQPGGEAFSAAAFWAVASVTFVCLRDLVTRRLSAETPSLLVTLATAVSITAMGGLITLHQGWTPVSGGSLLRLAGAAGFVFVGYLFSVKTMREGDIGFVSPFRYTIMIWALLLGYFVFGDIPNFLAGAGAALIVASGVYAFHRERIRSRR